MGWCPWNTIISQAECCDQIFAKMRLKLRNEGYGGSPAFLQYSFLTAQTFSVLLLSLSSNPPISLSHQILKICTTSSENDAASAPTTPGYHFSPSFTECLMLIRIQVTNNLEMLRSRLLRSLIFSCFLLLQSSSCWFPHLPNIYVLTWVSWPVGHWWYSLHDRLPPIALGLWPPPLGFLVLATASWSSLLFILAADCFSVLCPFSFLSHHFP